jgi:hypothetical protein
LGVISSFQRQLVSLFGGRRRLQRLSGSDVKETNDLELHTVTPYSFVDSSFEVFTAVPVKIVILWDVKPCSFVEHRRKLCPILP